MLRMLKFGPLLRAESVTIGSLNQQNDHQVAMKLILSLKTENISEVRLEIRLCRKERREKRVAS